MKITHPKCSLPYNQIHGELHNCVLVMASSPQVVSVSKMSAWWMLMVFLLILEDGESTIPDHQDTISVEDRWKEYRNIDSVIAGADYSDEGTEKNIDENKLNSNVSKTIHRKSEDMKYEPVTEADVMDITKVGLHLILCTWYLII
jgi:hypothetical protein